MSTTKPSVEHFAPLISRIERISATTYWLTMAGRATLVDMAISSVPIYTMCSIKMHTTNIHSIDRIRKNGLWRGSEVVGKGAPLVAWKNVTTPKEKGGLGLKNLLVIMMLCSPSIFICYITRRMFLGCNWSGTLALLIGTPPSPSYQRKGLFLV
jgi:hypothetical protein